MNFPSVFEMSERPHGSLFPKMDTARWQRAKSILAAALGEKSPAAQVRFVRERCGADAALCGDVLLLLDGAGPLADNLERCAEKAAVVLGSGRSLRIGKRVGAYEILEEIGRGGMGAVYLAARADGHFESRVAIKVLKRGTDTEEMLGRFVAERRILARLNHPNIARLLDAGTTDDGLPYFVMEYVDGKPITAFAADRQLPIAERLELFLKVCSALHFAHQNGVVHRDLKANNILVGTDGEPKLLDFGIAKLLSADERNPSVTSTRDRRLTPLCASPEQARGEAVTGASDVYALGALLYELLTDQSPYRFAMPHPSFTEVARVICEQQPSPPSLRLKNRNAHRSVVGDLDNIVLYAMRKEAERRYPSVLDFADDIRRLLGGRPVRARANTIAYRARRFVGRNRKEAVRVLLTATLLALIGQSVLVFFFGSRSDSQNSVRDYRVSPFLNAEVKSIAILPFETFGEGEINRHFVEVLQDEITIDLTRGSDLKVISSTNIASSLSATKDVREIGNVLGVSHVLAGSVQRLGDRVRVNAHLIDTGNAVQTWAEHYDWKISKLGAVETELAQGLATQLETALTLRDERANRQEDESGVFREIYPKARAFLRELNAPSVAWRNTCAALDLAYRVLWVLCQIVYAL